MPDRPATFVCPKCRRPLTQSGVVTVDGLELPTFQCDECLRGVRPFAGGPEIEVALTFCVRPDGSVYDPSSNDGVLRW